MKKYLLLLIASGLALTSFAAKVSYSRYGVISYSETTKSGKIDINFQKCMINNLFTFYTVSLDGKIVNSAATSDNIGPFNAGGTWMGGNHNTPQGGSKPSANTVEVTATVDGVELTKGGNALEGSVLIINVTNEIFYTDDKKFADELMTYRVSGNSIEVWAEHIFHYPTPMIVSRYYGPQSMFPATELLLPGTKNKAWISLAGKKEVNVMKSEFKDFSTFIEKSANGYQAVLKYHDGIGDASCISPSGEVYLFRNYGGATGKSYHVMMWDHTVKSGDKTNWHALYTWFNEPVEDTYRSGEGAPVFKYESHIDGESTVISLDDSGKSEETQTITELWKTEQVEAFKGNWDGKTLDWDTPESIKDGSNTRFATAYGGKIYTIDQMTMSIAEVTKEGTLVPTYYLPKPANVSDYYGTAIAVDEVGNFLIGMNFTQRPASSTKFAIYNTTAKACKEFNLEVPEGWTVGRLDCIGRVLGDLTKDAVFTIVPEASYVDADKNPVTTTSAVRVIGVKGDGDLESVTVTDLGDVSVAGNYTQQNIAQPVYRTMAEAKAANGTMDFYYSSCNGTSNYYASYIGGEVTNDFARAMLKTSIAGTNGFDTFVVNGKRYFVRNWAEKAGDRTMNIVVMDENGNELAKWINYSYVLDGGYSSIVAEPLEDNTVNIYVFNSGNKLGAAAKLNFDPAIAGEAIIPEDPDPAGAGTEEDPLVISTPAQLANLNSSLIPGDYTYIEFANDIDMDGVSYVASLTTAVANVHIDGKNHVIKNLTISTGANSGNFHGGLFANMNGSVKNLGFVDVDLTCSNWGGCGAIAGYIGNDSPTTIENCFVTGNLHGPNAQLGSFASGSKAGGATISNCYSTAILSSTGGGIQGGIVGSITYTADGSENALTINNSYFAGSITGSTVGGLVGANQSYLHPATGTEVLNLNNCALLSASLTGAAVDEYVNSVASNGTITLTVNADNVLVGNNTTINGTAVADGIDEEAIVKEIMGWEGFNPKEVNEVSAFPILAWQNGVPYNNTGVIEIEVGEDIPAVYYNLQGVEIAKPENGIYIVRRGNKVAKELVK